MGALVSFVILLLSIPPLVIWRAYVAIVLWGWFVAPYWSVRTPSIYEVGGIFFLLSLLETHKRSSKKDEESLGETVATTIIFGTIFPALTLAFAWVWKSLAFGI